MYDSKFKSLKEGLVGDSFEGFFLKNAVQHYNYTLQSVGYISGDFQQIINLNLWLDECYFKKSGSSYYIEHKKIGAKIVMPIHAMEVVEEYSDEDGNLKVTCIYRKDKNVGSFVFMFMKNRR